MENNAQPQAQTANQPDIQTDVETGSNDKQAFLTVRYNKEELPLSREAATEYAQKGLNYDKISGRLSQLSQKVEDYQHINTLVSEIAQQNGISENDAFLALRQRVSEEGATQASINAQLDEFIAAHPDYDPLSLPESVINEWKSGVSLCDAYAAYEEIKIRQVNARQTNEQNAAASMGGAQGIGAAAPKPLSKEVIAQMSHSELENNHGRIWAFLTGQKE